MNEQPSILIVDDNQINGDLIMGMLDNEPYKLQYLSSAEEALSWLAQSTPELILLDVMMPEVNGFELCRQLKQSYQTKDIPVIFVTARADEKSIVEGFSVGGIDYVTKPFKQYELVSRIRTHLELSYSRKRLKQELLQRKQAERKIKLSEQKFRNLFNISNDAILITTQQGLVVEANETASNLFDEENLIKKNLSEVFLSTQNELISSKLQEAQETEMAYFALQIHSQDNEKIELEITMRMIPYHYSTAIMVVIHDNTHQHLLREKIVSAVIQAENKERQRFAENLHDDLGPLLSSLKLYISLMDRNATNEKISKLVRDAKQIIDIAIKSTKSIANNLNPHVLENFGFKTALHTFCQQLKNVESLSVQIVLPDDFPELSSNAENSFYRILTELLNNTVKHAKASESIITFSLVNEQLIINYSDNGIGLQSGSAPQNDTGMGLHNIISRVESMEGTLHIKASEESGFSAVMKFNTSKCEKEKIIHD